MQKGQTFNDSSCLNAVCLRPLETVTKDQIEDDHFKEAPLNKQKELGKRKTTHLGVDTKCDAATKIIFPFIFN